MINLLLFKGNLSTGRAYPHIPNQTRFQSILISYYTYYLKTGHLTLPIIFHIFYNANFKIRDIFFSFFFDYDRHGPSPHLNFALSPMQEWTTDSNEIILTLNKKKNKKKR